MTYLTRTLQSSRRAVLALGAGFAFDPSWAQEAYPSKRIEIIVPFPAGGTADFLGRVIGQKLAEAWGQQVVISNKPGAAGSLEAVTGILRQPDVVERFVVQGAPVPPPMTPAQVTAFVRNDVAMWRKLVSEAGIQAD